MRKHVVAFLALTFILACSESKKKAVDASISLADTAKYYPIHQFIEAQIQYVDLRNFTITQKSGTTLFTDSMVITKDAFIALSSSFLQITKSWLNQRHVYKETVFQDLGTESYTLNYTALSKSTPLQSIDVLLSEQTNLVKRLFMREQQVVNDTLVTRQYSWVADRRFQWSESKKKAEYTSEKKLEVEWKN